MKTFEKNDRPRRINTIKNAYGTLRGPVHLEITTKIGCSNICEYCPQTKLIKRYSNLRKNNSGGVPINKKDTYMSIDTFKKCISTVPSDVDMHFAGYTEPFDNPECADMMLHASKMGHVLACNTTLDGLNMHIIERIRHIPFKQFNIHLPSAEYYELIGAGKPLSVLETGQHELSPEWINVLKYITTNPMPRQKFHCHGGLHPDLAETEDPIYDISLPDVPTIDLISRAGNLLKKYPERPLPPELNPRGKCNKIFQNVLLPDGSLALCCMDYGLDGILGNLLEQTWTEYQQSNKYIDALVYGHDICDYCLAGVKTIDKKESWPEWRKETKKPS